MGPLHRAARKGDAEMMNLILAEGVDINQTTLLAWLHEPQTGPLYMVMLR